MTDFVNWMNLPNAKYRLISTVLATRDADKLKGRLSNITAPTLIVWGGNDKVIPLHYPRQYDEIPIIKHLEIKNCGHIPHVGKPIEFGKIIQDFLLLDDNKQEGNELQSK